MGGRCTVVSSTIVSHAGLFLQIKGSWFANKLLIAGDVFVRRTCAQWRNNTIRVQRRLKPTFAQRLKPKRSNGHLRLVVMEKQTITRRGPQPVRKNSPVRSINWWRRRVARVRSRVLYRSNALTPCLLLLPPHPPPPLPLPHPPQNPWRYLLGALRALSQCRGGR